jgi:hypothetical protein
LFDVFAVSEVALIASIQKLLCVAYIFIGFLSGGRSFLHNIPCNRRTISSLLPSSLMGWDIFQHLDVSRYTGEAVVHAPSSYNI